MIPSQKLDNGYVMFRELKKLSDLVYQNEHITKWFHNYPWYLSPSFHVFIGILVIGSLFLIAIFPRISKRWFNAKD